MQAPAALGVHWIFLTHPIELLRSTSTARLAVHLLPGGGVHGNDTAEMLVYGSPSDQPRLDAVLTCPDDGVIHLLFPPPPCVPTADCLSVAQAYHSSRTAPSASADKPRTLTIVVPDGSWECARALVRTISASSVPVRFIGLSEDSVALHKSSLLEALHAGTGRGRPSTLEACALFIAEASQAMQLAWLKCKWK